MARSREVLVTATRHVTNMTSGVGTKLTTAMPSRNCWVVMKLLMSTKERRT